MWTIRFRLHGDFTLNKLTHKYNVTGFGYPLGLFRRGKKPYANAIGRLIGTKKAKKAFLKDLKKAEAVPKFEAKGDQFVFQLEQVTNSDVLFNPEFIYIEPVRLTKNHYQEYYIGSWNREKLAKILDLKLEEGSIEVLSFKNEKITKITVVTAFPQLTEKQIQAFKSAYKEGYYNFPRRIELQQLASKSKKALSTYQAHLRKAEKKIMNFFYKSHPLEST